jgi:hypothetical protein
MPAPLVPPDTVIPRLPWVPVYAARLFESDFFAVATDAEFRAAICLWLKSWNQKPPGSLPNNDRVLCRLAGLADDIDQWRSVKRVAMRHWKRCDDGRLYHPVVAELVMDAANRLSTARNRTAAATAARWKTTKDEIRNGIRNGRNLDRERDSPPSTKADPLPPYPPPHGKGGSLPPSSSLNERGRFATDRQATEQHELYAAINQMRFDRGDASRAGKLSAWDAEYGAKLDAACKRLAQLQDEERGHPDEETFTPLATIVATLRS